MAINSREARARVELIDADVTRALYALDHYDEPNASIGSRTLAIAELQTAVGRLLRRAESLRDELADVMDAAA